MVAAHDEKDHLLDKTDFHPDRSPGIQSFIMGISAVSNANAMLSVKFHLRLIDHNSSSHRAHYQICSIGVDWRIQ